MTVEELDRYIEPTYGPPRACDRCRTFRPEVVLGEPGSGFVFNSGRTALCWLCAHDVLEHGAPPTGQPRKHCGCPRDHVYPRRVAEYRAALAVVDVHPAQATQSP